MTAEIAFGANLLQIIWFVLIAVTMIAYYILDGFDLGVAILYPFLGKNEDEKRMMRNSIGPVWDGNEVWLLTAGGATFAAFPPAYAATFSGFYLAIMLVLFGLILRAVAIHFAGHGAMTGFWHFAFFIGSLVPAILFGAAVGNLLNTVPLLANGDVAGTFPGRFIQLLGVFPLVCGVLSLVMAIMQGAGWLALRMPHGDLRDRAIAVRRVSQVAALVLFAVGTVVFWTLIKSHLIAAGGFVGGAMPILRIIFAVLVFAALLGAVFMSAKGSDLLSFILSSVAVAMVICVAAASLFPALVPAGDPALTPLVAKNVGQTITIGAPFASSNNTLTVMTIIACIGVPIVLIYHVIVYKIFAHRVTGQEEAY